MKGEYARERERERERRIAEKKNPRCDRKLVPMHSLCRADPDARARALYNSQQGRKLAWDFLTFRAISRSRRVSCSGN